MDLKKLINSTKSDHNFLAILMVVFNIIAIIMAWEWDTLYFLIISLVIFDLILLIKFLVYRIRIKRVLNCLLPEELEIINKELKNPIINAIGIHLFIDKYRYVFTDNYIINLLDFDIIKYQDIISYKKTFKYYQTRQGLPFREVLLIKTNERKLKFYNSPNYELNAYIRLIVKKTKNINSL